MIKKAGGGRVSTPPGLVALPTKYKYLRSATQLESILCHVVHFSYCVSYQYD